MRSGILCYIFPHVEHDLVFCVICFHMCNALWYFCVILFCMWNTLWYFVFYFSVRGTRSGIFCCIFCCIFLHLVHALVFCVIYFPAFLFISSCIILTLISLKTFVSACLKLSLIYMLWYCGIFCYIFPRVERALVLWYIFPRLEHSLVLVNFVLYFSACGTFSGIV